MGVSAWAYPAQPPPLCRLEKKGDSSDLGPEAVTSDRSELSCSEILLLSLAPQLQFWDRSSAAQSLLLSQQVHLIQRLVTPLHGWQATLHPACVTTKTVGFNLRTLLPCAALGAKTLPESGRDQHLRWWRSSSTHQAAHVLSRPTARPACSHSGFTMSPKGSDGHRALPCSSEHHPGSTCMPGTRTDAL